MSEPELSPNAALIAGAQKAEHYEIASYGTLAYYAELLGNDRAKDLLGQTLDEEKAADEKLTILAEGGINQNAAEIAHPGEEAEPAAAGAGTGRKSASSGAKGKRR